MVHGSEMKNNINVLQTIFECLDFSSLAGVADTNRAWRTAARTMPHSTYNVSNISLRPMSTIHPDLTRFIRVYSLQIRFLPIGPIAFPSHLVELDIHALDASFLPLSATNNRPCFLRIFTVIGAIGASLRRLYVYLTGLPVSVAPLANWTADIGHEAIQQLAHLTSLRALVFDSSSRIDYEHWALHDLDIIADAMPHLHVLVAPLFIHRINERSTNRDSVASLCTRLTYFRPCEDIMVEQVAASTLAMFTRLTRVDLAFFMGISDVMQQPLDANGQPLPDVEPIPVVPLAFLRPHLTNIHIDSTNPMTTEYSNRLETALAACVDLTRLSLACALQWDTARLRRVLSHFRELTSLSLRRVFSVDSLVFLDPAILTHLSEFEYTRCTRLTAAHFAHLHHFHSLTFVDMTGSVAQNGHGHGAHPQFVFEIIRAALATAVLTLRADNVHYHP